METGPQITTVSAVPSESTMVFRVRNTKTEQEKEAFLTRVTGRSAHGSIIASI